MIHQIAYSTIEPDVLHSFKCSIILFQTELIVVAVHAKLQRTTKKRRGNAADAVSSSILHVTKAESRLSWRWPLLS